jgi:hypothetical protein
VGLKLKISGRSIKDLDGEEIGRRVKLRLDQEGERAVKGLSEVMKARGHDIMETAREFAPFRAPGDGGNPDLNRHLDHAIDMKVSLSGVNRRLAVVIFINGRKLGNQNKTIAQYAYLIHEGLEPYGGWKRGKGTVAKGLQAGGRFMTRAYEAYKERVIEESAAFCRKIFK